MGSGWAEAVFLKCFLGLLKHMEISMPKISMPQCGNNFYLERFIFFINNYA